MPKTNDSIEDISMANTKKEMLAAYQELVEKLEEQRRQEQKPEAAIKERDQQKAIKKADELSAAGVTQSIGELRGQVNTLIGSLSDKLDSELQRYNQIQEAVKAQQQELDEIYEIQKQASSLAALIEAQRQRRQEFESEMQEKKSALQQEIDNTRQAWEAEKKKHDAEIKERDAMEAKARQRQKEEFEYQFNREKQQARDAFEDEKAKQERELSLKKETVEKDLAERQKAVAERENAIDELEKRIQILETEKKTAVDQAVKELSARLNAEFKAREELMKQEFAGEKNVLNTRIQSLDQTVKEQRAQLESLSKQLDKAAEKVQDIAVRAIEGSSHSKVVDDLQQWLRENRRPPATAEEKGKGG